MPGRNFRMRVPRCIRFRVFGMLERQLRLVPWRYRRLVHHLVDQGSTDAAETEHGEQEQGEAT